MTNDKSHEIDPARTIDLGNGWSACVAVAPDGTEGCWLVSPDPRRRPGCACAECAPHDQISAPPTRPATTDTSTRSSTWPA